MLDAISDDRWNKDRDHLPLAATSPILGGQRDLDPLTKVKYVSIYSQTIGSGTMRLLTPYSSAVSTTNM